jgi:hypothetical protein
MTRDLDGGSANAVRAHRNGVLRHRRQLEWDVVDDALQEWAAVHAAQVGFSSCRSVALSGAFDKQTSEGERTALSSVGARSFFRTATVSSGPTFPNQNSPNRMETEWFQECLIESPKRKTTEHSKWPARFKPSNEVVRTVLPISLIKFIIKICDLGCRTGENGHIKAFP